ncbi:hypothetical protein GCM10010466_30830 [Planomonospora alba]|uniref:Enoyl reductase (ER) domain-containing protein n=1 Tax=Planomonospora alba TaxID=161354 RepID=A0ABP6N642_9ACTN
MVQAIGVTRPGGPEALGELDLAAEPIGPGQVRIRVTSATVNPVDAMVRSRPRQDEADEVRVPGMEVAGVITEIGPAADRAFTAGEAVMAIVVPSGGHGGYRADLVVPARSVAKIPAGLSEVQAATIPMNGLLDAAALEAAVLPAVKDGGTVVTVRGYRGDGTGRIRVAPVFVRDYAEAAAELDRLAELAGEGRLTVRVAGRLPASRAADAHRSLGQRGVRGRFVLRFD